MKILIKDDYGIYRKGIRELIKEHYPAARIMEADSTTDLFDKIISTGCDLVIANFYDQQETTSEEFRLFRQKFPKIPVIILGSVENALWTAGLMASGASGYLNRNCAIEEVIAVVDQATYGMAVSSASISSDQ